MAGRAAPARVPMAMVLIRPSAGGPVARARPLVGAVSPAPTCQAAVSPALDSRTPSAVVADRVARRAAVPPARTRLLVGRDARRPSVVVAGRRGMCPSVTALPRPDRRLADVVEALVRKAGRRALAVAAGPPGMCPRVTAFPAPDRRSANEGGAPARPAAVVFPPQIRLLAARVDRRLLAVVVGPAARVGMSLRVTALPDPASADAGAAVARRAAAV